MTGARLGIRASARLLGVHENTIRNMVDDGRLPVAQVLPRSGYRRFDRTDVLRAKEGLTTMPELRDVIADALDDNQTEIAEILAPAISRAVGAHPMPDKSDRGALIAAMDACLIAITDGQPVPSRWIAALPPWRAVLLARVAAKAGADLEHGTLDQLVAEAQRVGGSGKLVWPRGRTSHRRPR